MFFSPDAKGEYLYGSGQDAINWAWAAVHGAICQFVNDETLGEPESFDRFVQGVTNGQTATMYETHCVEYQGGGGYAFGAGFGRGTTYVVSVYEIAGGIGGDIAAGGELVISFGALGEVAIPQAAISTAVVAHGGLVLIRNLTTPIVFAKISKNEGQVPIIGNAQDRADPTHAARITAEAKRMQSTGKYKAIYLNKELRTVTNGRVVSRLRPDIVGLTNDGKYELVEVVSPSSQTFDSQEQKISDMLRLLTNSGLSGIGRVVP